MSGHSTSRPDSGRRTLILCSAWLLSSAAALAQVGTTQDTGEVSLPNGSFETLLRLKAPPPANSIGQWVLKNELQTPETWRLSAAYPGELTVLESGAPHGERFLHVAAAPKRAAHLCQAWTGLRRGLTYEVTLRYRGGPVELKVYEYDAGDKLKTDRPFATGEPTPSRDGPWSTLKGIYRLPDGMVRAVLALAIPAGSEADLDDVRLARLERKEGWLNVRDFGASGSEFEATADTTAGSRVITLSETGDFEAGQHVAVSACNPHISDGQLWSTARSLTPRDFAEQLQARGYDGSLGNWTVYVLDFPGTTPPTFRWSADLGLSWTQTPLPVTAEWQPLSGGVEVRFPNPGFWVHPTVASFGGRDQLVSTITQIEGNTLTLADATPISAKGCAVQHTDSGPLQRAFTQAVGEGRNVFIPAGRYRLTKGLVLQNAAGITVQGENEERTVLDITNGTGACLSIVGGTSVTVRNLRFRGFSGFAERKQMGSMRTHGYAHMWGFFAKHCNAIGIRSPERVLVENCHATGMSAECFYSASRSRSGNNDPAHYTKSIVYRNCTVTDCARNAFNNNDHAENTAVLYCRIQDVGGCSWEGASRFVKIVGNYMRNAGTVAIGNTRSRGEAYDVLPTGQHIVTHNTFEQEMAYGGCAIRSSAGATPVVISNNIFVNFNTSAIETSSFGDDKHLPSANTIVTGNAIDLTCVRDNPRARFGIRMGADDATVSDNQIYVRGAPDPLVRGIVLTEPARNLVVHDNIVRNCGIGLQATRTTGTVAEVLGPRTFRCGRAIAWPRRRSHCYRGYGIAWLHRGRAAPVLGPQIDAFDPEEGVFRLTADADLKKGMRFALHSPQGFRWNIHDNIIDSCTKLVDLDVLGGPTAVFAGNLLARGDAEGVETAVEIRGLFRIENNQFAGFDQPGSVALMLHPDPLGRPTRLVCRGNTFDQCPTPIGEGAEGVWENAITDGNVFGNETVAAASTATRVEVRTLVSNPGERAVLKAVRRQTAPTIDGNLTDWSWQEAAPLAVLARTHEDLPSGAFTARALAAHDAEALYLALDITLPEGQTLDPANGVEWSLASIGEKQPTPIYVLVGKADGSLDSLTAMGADAAQAATLKAGTEYVTRTSAKGWTCEWRLAWSALGVAADAPPEGWQMNIGVHSVPTGTWLVWVPTGGRVCDVENAGILRLAE